MELRIWCATQSCIDILGLTLWIVSGKPFKPYIQAIRISLTSGSEGLLAH